MTGFEKITFVIPFNNDDELIKPITSFKAEEIPGDLKINFRIGFVGLKPGHRYHFKIFINPIHLKLKVGEQAQLQSPFSESAKMFIDTPDSKDEDSIDGQLNVEMGKINIAARGIYEVKSVLTDSDAEDSELHVLTTFFSVETE